MRTWPAGAHALKSLYSILGVAPDASAAQIETAYAHLLSQMQAGAANFQGEDGRMRFFAIREAYGVLADAGKRQAYNQKLFAPEPTLRPPVRRIQEPDDVVVITSGGSSGFQKVMIACAVAIVGYGVYAYNQRQVDAQRLQNDAQQRAAQLQEQAQQDQSAEAQARLQRQRELDAKSDSARAAQQEQMQRAQDARDDAIRAQQERQEAANQAAADRKLALDAQQRLARDKALLRSLEIEHYGHVITTN